MNDYKHSRITIQDLDGNTRFFYRGFHFHTAKSSDAVELLNIFKWLEFQAVKDVKFKLNWKISEALNDD